MLNLKKVIASICVIAMVLTTVAFGATYTDVAEDSVYYEAVETLTKMGIVEGYDGEYRPEDGVTRAEMAKLIACIQGYGETAKAAATTAFTDVPSSHWASGYIANAAGMGIINGYGDGTFGPEDPVLYEQAIKMVMATLGYTPFAEKNGGYPTGYLAAAQRYNVSLAVANASVGTEANRGTVAQILVNAIDTPLMVQAGWNTNGEVEYKIAEGELVTEYVYDSSIPGYVPVTTTKGYKTLMSENLGYVKIRGVLYADDYTNLYGGKTIDTTEESKVWINVMDNYGTENKKFLNKANKDEYLVADVDTDGLLGRSVIAYTKANVKDEFELVSIAVDTNRNDELVINLDQYAGYDSKDSEIDYYKDGANTTTGVKVPGADVIFNNVGGYSVVAMHGMIDILKGGNITLIDNDEYNGYDVAIVKMASTGVVDEVGTKAVSLKSGPFSKINLNIDESKVVKFIKEGEEIEAADLAEWDILSIYAINKNSDYIVAEVVANEVVGTITSTKTSDTSATGVAFKVGDNWYDVANGAYGEGMGINEGGTFYIDEFGKIAAFVEDAALAGGAAANYGYVNAIKVDEADFGNGADFGVKLQLITADGVEVFNLKNNATLCAAGTGTDYQIDIETWVDANSDGVVNSSEVGYSEWQKVDAFDGTVVQFTKNSNGYITKLAAAGYKKTSADDFNFTASFTGSNLEYDADNSRLIGGGYVEEDAIVFITSSDAANCKLGSLADLSDKNKYTVLASYKDKKADYTSILVVGYTDIAAASSTDAIAVITEAGDTTNENGEAIWTLSYYQDGQLVEAVKTTADVAAGSQPTAGDIVKVKLGSDGLIVKIDTVWNFTTAVRTAKIADLDGTAADYALATPNLALMAANSTLGEAFYGGYVTSFAKNSKLFAVDNGITTWDHDGDDPDGDGFKADGTTTATAPVAITCAKSDLKLTNAENIYVIDATGRTLSIDTATAGDFTYLSDKLYDGTTNVNIFDDEGKFINDTAFTTGYGTATEAAVAISAVTAQKYADHIYVRMYEDKLIDVVIVKGAPISVE